MKNNFKIIKSIENKLLNNIEENKFVLIDGFYINVSGGFKKRINRLVDLKDLNKFPSFQPKVLRNIISSLSKGEKVKWSQLVGTFIMSYLNQKKTIFINSDYFICRKQIISIYSSQDTPFVLKTCLHDDNIIKQINQEIKNYLLIESLEIKFNKVQVPKVLYKGNEEGLPYFTLEYVIGDNLKGKNRQELAWIYITIFDFLFEIYKKIGVELHLIKYHHHTKNISKVKEKLVGFKGFDFILNKYEILSSTQKKLPYSFVHRDLSHNNIILKNSIVYLIDFGKSRKGFLIEDWDTEFFDSANVHKKFLKEFSIDYTKVFSFYEQVFLIRFLEIIKLVNNGNPKKTGFNNKIQTKIDKLVTYYNSYEKHFSIETQEYYAKDKFICNK